MKEEFCQHQLNKTSWHNIVWWPEFKLCQLGIDRLNLLCAESLPGAEKMDIGYCLRMIDDWAEKVKSHTVASIDVFEKHPERFGHSLGYFKAICLITALQRECGVRYNPAKRDLNVPLEVADSFIFGIIQGDGGTCASLPVLYCAVGHRLLYPMFLAHTQGDKAGHSFVQWDDGEVRFNIEASGEGMATPTDDHYRTGRFHLTPEIERQGDFLKPKNMRQSFAGFLAERAHCCRDIEAYPYAVDAMGWAAALDPENLLYLDTAKLFYNQWLRQVNDRKPPGFPDIFITSIQKRRFPSTVPLEFELNLCGLKTMECLLKNKKHDRNLWQPLRQGQRPAGLPVEVESKIDNAGRMKIRFLFDKKPVRRQGDFAHV